MALTKILVVEDEIITARDISLKLKKMDYEVIGIADSAELALTKVVENQPDLILMDIVLQGEIDGVEAAAKIRHNFDIPVVYLTAYADEETLQRAKITEPFGYLLKPFRDQELHTHIEIALHKHKLDQEMRLALEKQQELNELKSRLISIASHEFRTPLTTILGSTELLRYYGQNWPEEKRNKHFERINDTVDNMTEMLDNILIIHKAELGKLNFNPKEVNLVEICQEVVEQLQISFNTKIKINFTHEGEFQSNYLDVKLIKLVLNNLLSNAIKYSLERGEVDLYLCYKSEETIIAVRDKGIGIPKENLEELFDSFYRADNVGNISGTGLGLSIVKQAVNMHKGEIEVVSQLDKGTTFTITLPTACE